MAWHHQLEMRTATIVLIHKGPAAVMIVRCLAAGLKHDRRSVLVGVFLHPTGKC
jgi:hypothetical protein